MAEFPEKCSLTLVAKYLFVLPNRFTFHEEISRLKDIFHMNCYPKEIFYNHVMKFHSEKLMTTNNCQNMNEENKYTVIIPFIGHLSMTITKSLAKNLRSINKNVVQYSKHLKFKTTFL